MFVEIMGVLLAVPGLDLVVVPLTMGAADGGRLRAEQIVFPAREAQKPVVVYWPAGSLVRKGLRTLTEASVPAFASLAACAAALGAALEFHTREDRGAAMPMARTSPVAAPEGRGPLPWAEARRLLLESGVTMAPEVVVRSAGEAVAAAGSLGYPVAVKLLGPLHKTEAGGVRLGLVDADAVGTAMEQLLSRGAGGGACVVQPMVEGVEVLLGALRDPALGAFVVLAPGGTDAELYRERAMRPAPVTFEAAEAMLGETPGLAAR